MLFKRCKEGSVRLAIEICTGDINNCKLSSYAAHPNYLCRTLQSIEKKLIVCCSTDWYEIGLFISDLQQSNNSKWIRDGLLNAVTLLLTMSKQSFIGSCSYAIEWNGILYEDKKCANNIHIQLPSLLGLFFAKYRIDVTNKYDIFK